MFRTAPRLLAAAAFAVLPMTASAVVSTDIDADQTYTINETIGAGGTGTLFTFTALDRLRINSFTLAGLGSSAGLDLGRLSYTISRPFATGGLAVTTLPAPIALSFGAAAAPGGTFALGDTFTIAFDLSGAAARPVTVFASFDTAAVPLPAAGLLLLAALGGALALRRRKTQAAAPALCA